MQYYPYDRPLSEDILEIVDNNDRPILLQNYKNAKEFPHRAIVILLKNRQGKVLLWRHTEDVASWGLPFSVVRAGQARQEAAYALLQQKLTSLDIAISSFSNEEFVENALTIFGANIFQKKPSSNVQQGDSWIFFTTFFIITFQDTTESFAHKNLLWLDIDELHGFSVHFREMLNAKTLLLVEQGYINELI